MSSMRIAVGFKVTPDYDALRASDWAKATDDGVDTRYVRRVLDTYDEGALELALRLRDARSDQGLETGLAAFSVAGREADPFLKTLQALGYVRVVRVDPDGEGAALDFSPRTTASLIAACTETVGGDVLLLGCRSGPSGDDTIPFVVAEALGRPCVTGVTEIAPTEEDRLRVTFQADDGLVRATLHAPCVLAVGDAIVSHLRVPTLKDRLKCKDTAVSELSAADLGADIAGQIEGEPVALAGLERVDRRRAGVVVGGETPAAKARALYDSGLREELEKL